jgi:hypothetical protein
MTRVGNGGRPTEEFNVVAAWPAPPPVRHRRPGPSCRAKPQHHRSRPPGRPVHEPRLDHPASADASLRVVRRLAQDADEPHAFTDRLPLLSERSLTAAPPEETGFPEGTAEAMLVFQNTAAGKAPAGQSLGCLPPSHRKDPAATTRMDLHDTSRTEQAVLAVLTGTPIAEAARWARSSP